MSVPDRRTRWRQAVYQHPEATPSTKLVCLLLLDSGMKANGVVSVPRSQLARMLGVAPARITEAVNAAVDLGLLSRVARGYQHHTAVLQALVQPTPRGTENRTCQGTESVPPQPDTSDSQRYGYQYPNTRARTRTPAADGTGGQRDLRCREPDSNPRAAWTTKGPGEVSSHATSPDLGAEHPDDLPFLRAVG